MKHRVAKDLSRLAVISSAYILTFWLSGFALPALAKVGGVASVSFASLIFLPHGVRVIAAWLFGWRSVLYLAPAVYAVHFWRLSEASMDYGVLLMPLFGIMCVATTFEAVAFCSVDLRVQDGFVAPWRAVLLVGALASVINSLGTNLIVGNSIRSTLGYFVGDIFGMFALFLILIFSFKFTRSISG